MANVKVETGRPSIPMLVFADIYDISLGPRGNRPTIRGGTIVCGNLTRLEVMRILRKHQVPIERITQTDNSGHPVPLSVERLLRRIETTNLPQEMQSQETQSTVILEFKHTTGAEKAYFKYLQQLKRQEGFYFTRLEQLGESKGIALHDALSFICDAVNIFTPYSKYELYPWHLVEFKKKRESQDISFVTSLTPLENVAPELGSTVLDYVQTFEQQGDVTVDITSRLEDEMWIILGNEEKLLSLKSLANPS